MQRGNTGNYESGFQLQELFDPMGTATSADAESLRHDHRPLYFRNLFENESKEGLKYSRCYTEEYGISDLTTPNRLLVSKNLKITHSSEKEATFDAKKVSFEDDGYDGDPSVGGMAPNTAQSSALCLCVGVTVGALAVVCFASQNRTNYWIMHSLWHVFALGSSSFLLQSYKASLEPT